MVNIDATIGSGDFALDTNSANPQTLLAFLKRGWSHYYGNERAAKISTWKKSFAKANGREPNEAEIEAKNEEVLSAMHKNVLEGTIGHSVRGPALSTLDRVIERIARQAVVLTLRANGIKPPKDEETVTFAAGTPNEQTVTMEDLIDRWLDAVAKENGVPSEDGTTNRQVATAMAEAEIAAKKAKVDSAKVQGGVNSAADLF